jgi:hypothetical protein
VEKYYTKVYKIVGYDENRNPILEPDNDIPPSSASTDNYLSLLGAFIVDLPGIKTLFSTYQSSGTTTTDQKCIQCGDSSISDDGTTTYTCLDTSVVDNLIERVNNLPNEDLNRIMIFLDSLESTDRSLYLMFKSKELHVEVEQVDMKQIAIEAGLDLVVSTYKWKIPGFN